MENKDIIRSLRKTAAYMEILGENAFKTRAVSNAIFTLERVENRLRNLTLEELQKIDGIGKSIAQQIHEFSTEGVSLELQRLESAIPSGVQDLQGIAGLGAKKIRQLWQEYQVDSLEALHTMIESGALAKVKGFGEKTIEQIRKALEFREENRGKLLWARAEEVVGELINELESNKISAVPVGMFRRKDPIVSELCLLLPETTRNGLDSIQSLREDSRASSPYNWRGMYKDYSIPIRLRFADEETWGNALIKHTGPAKYISSAEIKEALSSETFSTEEHFYQKLNRPLDPAEIRGLTRESEGELIQIKDIKGILHAHSTYSDGQHTLTEMIEACIAKGYSYFGITDHSRSSYFYANGLFENRVIEQFAEIDALRRQFPNFTVFKGIECDILTDGKLDYADDILSQFDFIIASVHSVLNMDKETATHRLVRAIENPYTTMLGHLTGRLLLRRSGYPLHMPTILDACAANNVSIELNANPNRLDIDYSFLQEMKNRNIKTSINPDAHSINGIDDVRYGVYMAQKGGITAADNLTSYSADALEGFFKNRKDKRATT